MGDVVQRGRVQRRTALAATAASFSPLTRRTSSKDRQRRQQMPDQRDELDALVQHRLCCASSTSKPGSWNQLISGAEELVGVQCDGWIHRVCLGPGAAVRGLDAAQGDQSRPVHVVGDVARERAVRAAARRSQACRAAGGRRPAPAPAPPRRARATRVMLSGGLRATTTLCAASTFSPGVTSTSTLDPVTRASPAAAGRKSGVNPLRKHLVDLKPRGERVAQQLVPRHQSLVAGVLRHALHQDRPVRVGRIVVPQDDEAARA